MANEQTHAQSLISGGAVSKILSGMIHENLYDPRGLRELMVLDDTALVGSATSNVTTVTRGLEASDASSETSSGLTNSALTRGNFDLTVALKNLQLQASDLYKILGDKPDFDYLLGILVESFDLTLTSMLTGAFGSVTEAVGTSGSDLTVDDHYDAMFKLNLYDNMPPYAAVYHAQQVNNLVESIRSEIGPAAWRQDTQDMLGAGGAGWQGTFPDNCQIYQSSRVALANANADRRGCMFTRGAFYYKVGNLSNLDIMVNPADLILATPSMIIERDRDATNSLTAFIAKFYVGVAEGEDLRAVRVETDA